MNMKYLTSGIALVALCALSGCAEYPRAAEDYGKSLQQMVRGQTYDPEAAANPAPDAPNIGDGQRLEVSMENYRKDVAKGSEQARQDIVINVGD